MTPARSLPRTHPEDIMDALSIGPVGRRDFLKLAGSAAAIAAAPGEVFAQAQPRRGGVLK